MWFGGRGWLGNVFVRNFIEFLHRWLNNSTNGGDHPPLVRDGRKIFAKYIKGGLFIVFLIKNRIVVLLSQTRTSKKEGGRKAKEGVGKIFFDN